MAPKIVEPKNDYKNFADIDVNGHVWRIYCENLPLPPQCSYCEADAVGWIGNGEAACWLDALAWKRRGREVLAPAR